MYKSLPTPSFIMIEEQLKNNINELHEALKKEWPNYIIGYSYKTNSLPWLINFMKENSCYAEVVSNVEYDLAIKIGNRPSEIIFNGINKGKKHFLCSLKQGSIVNIDSWREIRWLLEEKPMKSWKVGVRVNLDLEKDCPNEVVMGAEVGRFGFSYENGELEKVFQLLSANNIQIYSLHFHHSTQTRSQKIYKTLCRKACEIAALLSYEVASINVGGGFYKGINEGPSFLDYIQTIKKNLYPYFCPEKTTLIVEPGASLVATGVYFLCEVIDVKEIKKKRFVTINGSRNNVDPLMIKTSYKYECYREDLNREIIEEQIIGGYTCMEIDRLFKMNKHLALREGDRLLFKSVGSYTMCLSPLFIEYFPAVYVQKGSTYYCVREPWGIEEYCQKTVLLEQEVT